MNIDYASIIQDIISGISVTAITAGIGYLFLNRYIEKINFSNKMRSYGFWETSMNKQSKKEIKKMCEEAVKIKIINVSGFHYLNNNEDMLKLALKRGVEIEFLASHPESIFLENIENMEQNTFINGKPLREKNSKIKDEIWDLVKKYDGSGLNIRFYTSEYRLPYVLCYYKDGSVDAWLTMTLPPYKSTKSFILRGKRQNDQNIKNDDEINFIDMMECNFDTIWNYGSKSIDEVKKEGEKNGELRKMEK